MKCNNWKKPPLTAAKCLNPCSTGMKCNAKAIWRNLKLVVLILVLLEWNVTYFQAGEVFGYVPSLNPCSTGMKCNTKWRTSICWTPTGLNPCSTGMKCNRFRSWHSRGKKSRLNPCSTGMKCNTFVTRRSVKLCCLNPCSTGMKCNYFRSYKRRENNVLILVLLEWNVTVL